MILKSAKFKSQYLFFFHLCDFLLGVDYFYEMVTVVIDTGTTRNHPPQCINFTIVGDNVFENDETIIFSLNSSDPSILDSSALRTFVIIIDDDGMLVLFILSTICT